MRYLRLLLPLLSLALLSCRGLGRYDKPRLSLLVADGVVDSIQPLPGIAKLRYQIFNVEDSELGQRMVKARHNFLLDFFRQSMDPYFGKERWSKQCLEKNQISPLGFLDKNFGFKAHLSIDENWNPGACSDFVANSIKIVVFCEKDRLVINVDATEKILIILPYCATNPPR